MACWTRNWPHFLTACRREVQPSDLRRHRRRQTPCFGRSARHPEPVRAPLTIEDTYDLTLDYQYPLRPPRTWSPPGLSNPNTVGPGRSPQAELVRWSLRMSPGPGQLRGTAQGRVHPDLQRHEPGPDGSMPLLHASSSSKSSSADNLGLHARRAAAEAHRALSAPRWTSSAQLGPPARQTLVITSVREVCAPTAIP